MLWLVCLSLHSSPFQPVGTRTSTLPVECNDTVRISPVHSLGSLFLEATSVGSSSEWKKLASTTELIVRGTRWSAMSLVTLVPAVQVFSTL